MADPDPNDPVQRRLVERAAAGLACPACGEVGFDAEWRLRAKPLGSFSLAGAQLKFSAREVLQLTCRHCGMSATPDDSKVATGE